MLFNSYKFLAFFPIVVLVFNLIPKKLRCYWLLLASYYFYMSWNVKYSVLIAGCTLVTWVSGLLLDRFSGENISKNNINNKIIRKLILAVCIIICLGVLCMFKYMDFIFANIGFITAKLGVGRINSPFSFVLPVGISFYTFQALSYTIDVYRGTTQAEKSPIKYALFVSFFPQLVAGPIERSENLLRQIKEIETKQLWNWKRIENGLIYMLYGFFLKVVIADNLSLIADEVFARFEAYGTIELIIGAIAFAIQIYCDFNSYSIIAIGAAQVCGFVLIENFHAPFLASSVKELWQRWHISLSNWFKDYIYFPLGGSRCSKPRAYANLMITFLISGLWHGANWTYVLWGGLNGLFQIVGNELMGIRKKIKKVLGINEQSILHKISKISVTFGLFCFSVIIFRSTSITNAYRYICGMFTRWNPWVLTDGSLENWVLNNNFEWFVLGGALLVLLVGDLLLHKYEKRIDKFLEEQGMFYQCIVSIMLLVMILVVGRYGGADSARSFIYFQF